ncbi:MAG: hypothetical protein KC502_03140 [Myxococcales bacterium]|nr:hypothetical protein [Myxococcales bacterium]
MKTRAISAMGTAQQRLQRQARTKLLPIGWLVLGLAALGGCQTPTSAADATSDVALTDTAPGDGEIAEDAQQDAQTDDAQTGDAQTGDAQTGDAETDAAAQVDASTSDAATAKGPCPINNYVACGGDPIGKWKIVALCPEDPAKAAALCEHPYDNKTACQGTGNQTVCTWNRTGLIELNEDKSAALSMESSISFAWTFDASCLAEVKPGKSPAAACSDLVNPKMSCEMKGALCHCGGTSSPQKDAFSGSWTIADGKLSVGAPGKKPVMGTFCRQGPRLTWDVFPHPISWRYWVLELNK